MKNVYHYMKLRQDDTVRHLTASNGKKRNFTGMGGLYELLDCSTIELISESYYENTTWYKDSKVNYKPKCVVNVYGDEEGRFNSENHRNHYFEVLTDSEGSEWDVVGDIIVELVIGDEDDEE